MSNKGPNPARQGYARGAIPTSVWYERLPDLLPGQIINSRKKAWFSCKEHGNFEMNPVSRARGQECRPCSIAKKSAKQKVDWYKIFPDLEPGQTNISGHVKAWFVCERGHRFDAKPAQRKHMKTGCRYCTPNWTYVHKRAYVHSIIKPKYSFANIILDV